MIFQPINFDRFCAMGWLPQPSCNIFIQGYICLKDPKGHIGLEGHKDLNGLLFLNALTVFWCIEISFDFDRLICCTSRLLKGLEAIILFPFLIPFNPEISWTLRNYSQARIELLPWQLLKNVT